VTSTARQPALFETEVHPMWNLSVQAIGLPPFILVFRVRLASNLVRFAGDAHAAFITRFARQVYDLSVYCAQGSNEPTWLVGAVALKRCEIVGKLTRAIEHCQPATKSLYRRDINVITNLAEQLTQAIAGTIQ
jgi:hypothetical protein